MPHKRAKRSVREQQRSQSGHDLAPGNQSINTEGIPKAIARVLNATGVRKEWREKREKRKADGEDVRARGAEGPAKKRRRKEEDGEGEGPADGNGDAGMKILPGESLAHFNRRVEDGMRPLVRTAMATASTRERKSRQDAYDAAKAARAGKSAKAAAAKRKHDPAASSDDEGEDRGADPPPPQSKPTKDKPAKEKPTQDAPKSASAPAPKPPRATEFATVSSSAPRRLNDIAQAPPSLSKVPRVRGNALAPSSAGGAKGAWTSKADGVLSMAQRAMMEVERERVVMRYRELKERRAAAAVRG